MSDRAADDRPLSGSYNRQPFNPANKSSASSDFNSDRNITDIDTLAEMYMNEIAGRMDSEGNYYDGGDSQYGSKLFDIFMNDTGSIGGDADAPPDPPPYARKYSRRELARKSDSSAERSKSSGDDQSDSEVSMDSSMSYPPRISSKYAEDRDHNSSGNAFDGPKRRGGGGGGGGKVSDNIMVRAKNREHAKNTRMRKRKYIETLKDTIQKISDDREKIDRDRKVALGRLGEQVAVRKKVLSEMLRLRCQAEIDYNAWSNILEENIIMILPITPYRSFPPDEVLEGQRVVKGIEGVIRDNASLKVMTQSIAIQHMSEHGERKVEWRHVLHEVIQCDDAVMCKWEMITENATELGGRSEVVKVGMLKAIFSQANKLVYFEEIFDVMSFMQQLRRASGRADFVVIPNTIALARECGPKDSQVITEGSPPYRILFASQAWQYTFGYTAEQILGQTCKILQGQQTSSEKVAQLMYCVRNHLPHSTVLKNYTRTGEVIDNWLRIYPLYTLGKVSHFLGIMERVDPTLPSFSTSSANSISNATNISSLASNTNNRALTEKNLAEHQTLGLEKPQSHSVHPSSNSGATSVLSSNSPYSRPPNIPLNMGAHGYPSGNIIPNVVPIISTDQGNAANTGQKKTSPSMAWHNLITPGVIQSIYTNDTYQDASSNVIHNMTTDNLNTFNQLNKSNMNTRLPGNTNNININNSSNNNKNNSSGNNSNNHTTNSSNTTKNNLHNIMNNRSNINSSDVTSNSLQQSSEKVASIYHGSSSKAASAVESKASGSISTQAATGGGLSGISQAYRNSILRKQQEQQQQQQVATKEKEITGGSKRTSTKPPNAISSTSGSNLDLDMLSGQSLSQSFSDSLFGPHVHPHSVPTSARNMPKGEQNLSLPAPGDTLSRRFGFTAPKINPPAVPPAESASGRRGTRSSSSPRTHHGGGVSFAQEDEAFMDVFLEFSSHDNPVMKSSSSERRRGGSREPAEHGQTTNSTSSGHANKSISPSSRVSRREQYLQSSNTTGSFQPAPRHSSSHHMVLEDNLRTQHQTSSGSVNRLGAGIEGEGAEQISESFSNLDNMMGMDNISNDDILMSDANDFDDDEHLLPY